MCITCMRVELSSVIHTYLHACIHAVIYAYLHALRLSLNIRSGGLAHTKQTYKCMSIHTHQLASQHQKRANAKQKYAHIQTRTYKHTCTYTHQLATQHRKGHHRRFSNGLDQQIRLPMAPHCGLSLTPSNI